MDGDVEREWCPGRRRPCAAANGLASGGEGDAECAADEREHKAFCQKLADDARAACAEGLADGELAGAGGGAGEQQVGDVGAGDEQHDAD